MARERIENGAVSTLNGSLTSGATTVAVSDGSVFSSAEQFRVIVDSEIMLVTDVSGNNLTVTRGAESTTAAAHNDGATIAQIITKEGTQRYMRDWNNPFFDDANGNPKQLLSSAGATLVTTDFTWANQGSATVGNNNSGSFLYTVDSTASNSVRLHERTLTAPWKVTAAFVPTWLGDSSSPACGIAIKDNAVGTFKNIALEGDIIMHHRWTNTTTFGTNQSTNGNFVQFGHAIWLQAEDNNTDHFFRVSNDGVNWLTLVQETRTTHTATPDRVAVYLNNLNTTFDMLIDLVAWIEE